jgi:hypothetical protein
MDILRAERNRHIDSDIDIDVNRLVGVAALRQTRNHALADLRINVDDCRMNPPPPSRPTGGDGVLHPLALLSLAVWLLNDHVWKAAAAGTRWGMVTGKLSDVAGLVFYPTLMVALVELVCRRVINWKWVVSACTATMLVFALIKLWPPAGEAYRWAFGGLRWPLDVLLATLQGRPAPPLRPVDLWRDATDLWAVPAGLAAMWLGIGRSRRNRTDES